MIGRRPASDLSPRMRVWAAIAVPILLAAGFFTASSLFATEARPAVRSRIIRADDLKLPGELSRMNVVIGRPDQYKGRLSGAVGHIRPTDTRPDMTSVQVASLADGGNEKESNDYIDASKTDTAVLPTDPGKAAPGQENTGAIIGGTTSKSRNVSHETVCSDNFIGHTREYLQTKK